MLVGLRPFGMLGHDQAADPLGEQPLRRVGLKARVRAGSLGEEMLLVAQALAGGAVEDPVLLPLVQDLEAFEQHDGAGGSADQEGRRLMETRDVAVFGEDR